jgi:Holliday junction resolvase RusA-like endonuclease
LEVSSSGEPWVKSVLPEVFRFEVIGPPRAKARPRFSGRFAYTPKTTKDAEKRIQAAAKPIAPKDGLPTDRWRLVVIFNMGNQRKPDVDNLAKLVMDALNGIFWEDDRQVCQLNAIRFNEDVSKDAIESTMVIAERFRG